MGDRAGTGITIPLDFPGECFVPGKAPPRMEAVHVDAVDLSEPAIAHAREHYAHVAIHFQVGDIHHFDTATRYDLISPPAAHQAPCTGGPRPAIERQLGPGRRCPRAAHWLFAQRTLGALPASAYIRDC